MMEYLIDLVQFYTTKTFCIRYNLLPTAYVSLTEEYMILSRIIFPDIEPNVKKIVKDLNIRSLVGFV